MSKCRYCDSSNFGPNCNYSPTGNHEHASDDRECEYCGEGHYGPNCNYSPTGNHER